MKLDLADLPAELSLHFDAAPPPEFRGALARAINDFHSRTVPHESQRFGLRLQNADGQLKAGVLAVMYWDWLCIEALWVDDSLRGLGMGRKLMQAAEAHALKSGCHSVWLDTFQARAFYEALGFEVFGQLDHFPAEQTRYFMRRKLS